MGSEKLLEYAGYKVGQTVLVKRVPDGKLGYGKVHSIHAKELPEESAFTFVCEMCGSYRLGMFKDIIDDPTKAQMRKVDSAKIRLYRPRRKKK